jgi:superfamily II DNA or RNA helicase
MILRITDDKKYLQVVDGTANEIDQISFSFTKKAANWFIIKKKVPHWDGEYKFIDRYQRIPLGLWREVERLCKKFHFPLKIDGLDYLYDSTHNDEEFKKWALDYFKDSKITPRDYQLEGASRALKFKNCTEEISTSGGKTLIAFMIFKYLFDVKNKPKMLYIVPNVNLVTQTEEKFYEYEDGCGNRPNWKSDCAFGGARSKDGAKYDIVFGTYQTLSKKSDEYFEQFNAVCVDECHHSKAASIKNILIKCYNAEYKFGLTGTLPEEDSYDSFTIQSYLGPKVYTIHSADLIAAGNATPVHVVGIELDYLEPDIKKKLYDLRNVKADEKDGAKLLNLEKDVARESRKRFNYIVNQIASTTKNSLVLFSDIKNDYGRSIYNWIKENTEKNVYYIDGGTKNENRDYFKKKMEDQENTIIIASIGVFSEGIDILNVHNIFIVESYKSQFIVRQVLGRGMRLMDGKHKIMVIDFSDNFEYGSGYQKKNYLMRHADERQKIYNEKKFPNKRFKVKL